jgi:hypothetical protein
MEKISKVDSPLGNKLPTVATTSGHVRSRLIRSRFMALFKLITTLILQRTLAMVLNYCKILVVIYFNLFSYGKSWIVVLF